MDQGRNTPLSRFRVVSGGAIIPSEGWIDQPSGKCRLNAVVPDNCREACVSMKYAERWERTNATGSVEYAFRPLARASDVQSGSYPAALKKFEHSLGS